MEIRGKAKDIVSKTLRRFSQLQKQQRMLILLFIAAVLFSFYYNAIYKLQSGALHKSRAELQSLNNRLIKLKSQMPDIRRENESLEVARKTLDSLKAQLSSLELQLPTYARIPQLLGELVNQAQGYSIDFVSVRPKTTRGKKEYAQLSIEIKFNASYSDFVNYLNRLESLSQFLRATDIAIEEMKNGFTGVSGITITLATLLGEKEGDLPEIKQEPQFALPLQVERNPFFSKFRPDQTQVKKEELQLSGIIATGTQPTVIINNEVYRVGDAVGNKKVKEILSNMVILSDERERTVLTLD